MGEFRMDHKSASQYLDIAANGKGDEKAMLTIAALRRLRSKGVEQSASAVEVGPGGGAALRSLVSAHTLDEAGLLPDRLNISLVELDGLESSMLNDLCNSMHTNDKVSVRILGGDIRYLDSLQIPNVNVVAASAVLHEAYSYGGGYDAIDSSLAAITASLSDGGYFAYRDVLSFDKAVSLCMIELDISMIGLVGSCLRRSFCRTIWIVRGIHITMRTIRWYSNRIRYV